MAAAVALAVTAAAASLFTRTTEVEGLAVGPAGLWAATRGGLELYDTETLARRRLYTTADGLDASFVRAVEADAAGGVRVRTERTACALEPGGARFACRAVEAGAAPAPGSAATVAPVWPPPGPAVLFQGARVTAAVTASGGRRFVGTAGQGVWLAGRTPRRLTPRDQICGNHVVAAAEWRGRTWFGTFDEGLCSYDGHGFQAAPGRFTMINDVLATPDALYVAATKGLFRTRDGVRFSRVHSLDGRGAVDLAYDGGVLWVVTPLALWRFDGAGGAGGGAPAPRRFVRPGGSHALQAVDARGGAVWLASEDVGALRLTTGARGRARFEVFDRARGLPSSWAVDVAVAPDGGAWVATLRHGLGRVGGDGRVERATPGLPDGWLLHASLDGGSGALWVGTQAGLARLAPGDAAASAPSWGAAVPNPCVHAVAITSAGTWVGTEGGTLRVQ